MVYRKGEIVVVGKLRVGDKLGSYDCLFVMQIFVQLCGFTPMPCVLLSSSCSLFESENCIESIFFQL